MSPLSHTSFDREEVRVFELSSSSLAEALVLPAGPLDDALVFVHGGTAMVSEPGGAPMLVDAAHVLLARAQPGIIIQLRSAQTRCTVLTISGRQGLPFATPIDHDRPVCRVIPLGVDALFRVFWLRRALTPATRRPASDISRVARGIREGVTASARELPSAAVDGTRGRTQRQATADGARMRLAASVDQPHPLVEVARAVHASPFHLAHVFREEVGYSLHQYLVRLRLIAALDRLSNGASDLSALALDLGFSNHSHFSEAFRRAFGIVPREARRRLTSPMFVEDRCGWPEATANTRARCG